VLLLQKDNTVTSLKDSICAGGWVRLTAVNEKTTGSQILEEGNNDNMDRNRAKFVSWLLQIVQQSWNNPFIHLEFGNIKLIDCFDSTISHDCFHDDGGQISTQFHAHRVAHRPVGRVDVVNDFFHCGHSQ